MQGHFGGEHLWCEYPCRTEQEEGICQRAQWKVGPSGCRPQCNFVQKKKQINSCALCFRVRTIFNILFTFEVWAIVYRRLLPEAIIFQSVRNFVLLL